MNILDVKVKPHLPTSHSWQFPNDKHGQLRQLKKKALKVGSITKKVILFDSKSIKSDAEGMWFTACRIPWANRARDSNQIRDSHTRTCAAFYYFRNRGRADGIYGRWIALKTQLGVELFRRGNPIWLANEEVATRLDNGHMVNITSETPRSVYRTTNIFSV